MTKQKALQTPWYNKTVSALQLAGMSDRTQHCYARRAARMLIEHYYNKDNVVSLSKLFVWIVKAFLFNTMVSGKFSSSSD